MKITNWREMKTAIRENETAIADLAEKVKAIEAFQHTHVYDTTTETATTAPLGTDCDVEGMDTLIKVGGACDLNTEQGSWICQECEKDWGDGHIMFSTGAWIDSNDNKGHLCLGTGTHDGCDETYSVKWIPTPEAPESAEKVCPVCGNWTHEDITEMARLKAENERFALREKRLERIWEESQDDLNAAQEKIERYERMERRVRGCREGAENSIDSPIHDKEGISMTAPERMHAYDYILDALKDKE